MPQSSAFDRYGLSLEELVLAMGLINRPDLGRDLLTSIYPEVTESEANARLSAASHSLLARNLCSLNQQGQPVLNPELEKGLFPLVRFDRLYQIRMVFGESSTNTVVHVRLQDSFTARTVQAGVIHVLDTGPSRLLAEYFEKIFVDVRRQTNGEVEVSLKPGVLSQALEQCNNLTECQNRLVVAGWPAQAARYLAEDLREHIWRATLLRIDASQDTLEERMKSNHHPMLMLLKGKRRGWGFLFDGTQDDATGRAWQLNTIRLKRLFQEFTVG